MIRKLRTIGLTSYLALLFVLASCESLGPALQTPTMSLVSVESATRQGLQQVFRVGLKVENPNPFSIQLDGLSYTVELESLKVITGSVNQMAAIRPKESELVYVNVALGLVEGLQLVNRLMSKSDRQLKYRLDAKLNIEKPLPLLLPVSESGVLDLDKLMSDLAKPQSGGYSL